MATAAGYYTAMICFALLAVTGTGLQQARTFQLPRGRLLFCVVCSAAGSFLGARVWYVGTHWGTIAAEHLIDPQLHGLSIVGGSLLAAATGVLVCRFQELPVWRVADAISPGVFLAMALMKLGCFGQGCCAGLPTSLPWGVRFPLGSPAALRQLEVTPWTVLTGPAPIHPIQLYEALAYATVAGLLLAVRSSSLTGTRSCVGLCTMPLIHGTCLLFRDIPSTSHRAMYAGLLADLLVLGTAGLILNLRIRKH